MSQNFLGTTLRSAFLLLFTARSYSVENGHFYQDLTEIIDSCLISKTSHSFRLELEKALVKSTYVYYSTDLLLNNIAEVIPVFNLLNNAKPRSSRYHLMLSLRYTVNNQFFWKRLDDVFYNLSLNIPPETRTILSRHLTSIVLDWSTETCESPSSFFGRVANYHGYGFDQAPAQVTVDTTAQTIPSFYFPKYTKNFLQMYFCEEPNDCSNIPVGVAYNPVQINCADYLLNQIRDADFVLVPTTFPSHKQFPFAYQIFHLQMKTFDSKHERYIGRNWNKQIVYMVDIKDPPLSSQIKAGWKREWNDLESLLSTSTFYEDTVLDFVTTTHEMAMKVLLKYMLKYTWQDYIPVNNSLHKTTSGNRLGSIIFGNSMLHVPLVRQDATDVPNDMIIPHLYTDEILATPCSLKWGLEGSGNNRIIVNAYTWRAVARHILSNPNLNCSSKYSGFLNMDESLVDNKAYLVFDENIISMWNDMGKYMTHMLTQTQFAGATKLEAVMFPENGLTDNIQDFITSTLQNYSVGCVVNFNKERLDILKVKMMFLKNLNFGVVMRELCASILDQVETMIWKLDEVNIANGNDLMVVTRQIFMKEFPQKSILIQLPSGLQYFGDYIQSWSDYYRVPVIV